MSRIRIDRDHAVLIVVDMQPDFLPGGSLAVAEGDVIVEPIAELLAAGRFRLCVATQDWHPPDHISFASNHEGRKPLERIELYGHEQILWPDHCVQGTEGADLLTGLPWEKVSAIVRKATDPLIDSYSTFRNNWDPQGKRQSTGLGGYLKERGVRDVFLCGLARDFCVNWSAEDAVEAGFQVRVLWDLTRPVDPGSNDRVHANLRDRGVEIIELRDLS